MSTISKVFTVLNLVLALFLLGSVSAILAKSSDYKGMYDAKVAELKKAQSDFQTREDELTGKVAELTEDKRRLQNSKNDLESQNTTLEAERDKVQGDNAQLRNAVDGINASLSALQRDLQDTQARNKTLMDQNEGYRKTATDAEKSKMAAEDDRARLEGDIARLEEDLAERERLMAAVVDERDNLVAEREALESMGVPVAQLVGNVVPLIEGKVSDVGPGFVVLSVGENDGVRIGYPFDVYRGSDYVGRVVVTDVLPDNCTARIQFANNRGISFRALDNATTRL